MTTRDVIAKYWGSAPSNYFRGATKPYVRWWWLAGPFTEEDIAGQLRWVRDMGFGGVEIAWIFPSWLEDDPGARPEWLGTEWSELVAFAKQTADSFGLGCDFTFGSCWPFGGSWIEGADRAQTFAGASEQQIGCSWEQDPKKPTPVLNHLSAAAFERYARPLVKALRPALEGSKSALFCDSLELDTEGLWSSELWDAFEERYGYSIEPFVDELDENIQVRYDYRRLIAETIRREFYAPFTELCRRNSAYARVQCHGAPTDLLAAYAAVDVPESEALLFPPAFSRIAASAAAWSNQPVVSAEAFTCIYGFPGWGDEGNTHWREEQLSDLKLLADSLFANGVNQIVWHGMPYQPAGEKLEFYASVHVGPDSRWASELPAFNEYLEDVSRLMQLGQAYAGVGVYLPFEDALIADRIPPEERTPGANFRWEMRQARLPSETKGFAPLWISSSFLEEAEVKDGKICSRHLVVERLFVECEWLEAESLDELVRLAEQGARITAARSFQQPGYRRDKLRFERQLQTLAEITKDQSELRPSGILVEGTNLPDYFARSLDSELLLFFAHPSASSLKFPMEYHRAESAQRVEQKVTVSWRGRKSVEPLKFEPCEPCILLVSSQGSVTTVSLNDFRPQKMES